MLNQLEYPIRLVYPVFVRVKPSIISKQYDEYAAFFPDLNRRQSLFSTVKEHVALHAESTLNNYFYHLTLDNGLAPTPSKPKEDHIEIEVGSDHSVFYIANYLVNNETPNFEMLRSYLMLSKWKALKIKLAKHQFDISKKDLELICELFNVKFSHPVWYKK
jgi:hypothetical protein